MGRYVISIVTGVVVTLTLLFVMQLLIATGKGALTKPRERAQLDFVRVKRNENINTQEIIPDKPPKPPETPPETPPQDMDNIDPDTPTIDVARPTIMGGTDIGGPGRMNIAEGDYLPIVRVAPVYPSRALSRGLEGFVDMSFTVTITGSVINPIVLQSTSSMFERAATRAVVKFKYKPRVVDGIPVEVPGVKTRITFELQD
ncbi:MAG: energy transducer TonB [Gammaproteobacteria bacterium]|nr:energy transducer TonB [Gammaproteobacteria bacterium]